MNKQNKELPQIIEESEGCSLELSQDRKWMRLVVDGKLVASFHVNYVKKVLGNESLTNIDRPEERPSSTATI